MAETVAQTWQRITGKPWSEAKKLGLTNGSASANLALQQKLNSGYNPYASNSGGGAAAPAEADPLQAYKDLITQWYSAKPATPGTFNYSPGQEAADKASVSQEYRPFYQEQATNSGLDYTKSLLAAREGFSRRGLWGSSGGTAETTDPATGLAYTTATAPTTTGGPVSGLRQKGEQNINTANEQANTAFGRAYTAAVAGGVQGRQAEAQDVYQKTIVEPYKEQYQTWLTGLGMLK